MAMTAKEKQQRYRDRKHGVTVTENGNAEVQNVTVGNAKEQNVTATTKQSVTGCQHPPIIPVTKANRHLTYTKIGPSLSDLERYKANMPEPVLFTCPCCGKEWLCKRPDVQDAYCLRCDPVVGHCWREQHPYLRPPMADRSEALREFQREPAQA